MEIDHFDPYLPNHIKNNYDNLFLATRHCNGHKLKKPSNEDKALGLRFLNPCKEQDYGEHIFEDPDTFELWGATPEGRYHIRHLDLNADHLVDERKLRFNFRNIINTQGMIIFKGATGADEKQALKGVQLVKERVANMIHNIPQKPKPSLE